MSSGKKINLNRSSVVSGFFSLGIISCLLPQIPA